MCGRYFSMEMNQPFLSSHAYVVSQALSLSYPHKFRLTPEQFSRPYFDS